MIILYGKPIDAGFFFEVPLLTYVMYFLMYSRINFLEIGQKKNSN